MSGRQLFFIGCYTTSRPADRMPGRGISACALDRDSGALEVLATTTGLVNPSYLALDPERRRLYAVQETDGGEDPSVHAYAVDDDFTLDYLGGVAVPGASPCHLALSPDGDLLAVASYGDGVVALYRLDGSGGVGALLDAVQHRGKSVHPVRQKRPHAHATVFDLHGGLLHVPDLGIDEVRSYRYRAGRLEPAGAVALPPGSGPRHMLFHPAGEYAFVLAEIDSTLALLRRDGQGGLVPAATVSALPADFTGDSTCAALRLHPDGHVVYASNRGHDSVAVFAFDASAGRLVPVQHVSTGGRFPRDFALTPAGDLLVAANQRSATLTSFRVIGGRVEATGRAVTTGSPSCVLMTPWSVD